MGRRHVGERCNGLLKKDRKKRARRGRPYKAWGEAGLLYAAAWAALRRECRDLRPDDVEDLLQEGVLKALEGRRSYRPELGAPSTWMYCLAKSGAIRARRRQRRHPPTVQLSCFLESPRSAVPLVDRLALREAMKRLSRRDYWAIRQRFFWDRTLPEMAARSGHTKQAMALRVNRALRELRRILKMSNCPKAFSGL